MTERIGNENELRSDPATLVAIMLAARWAGDRDLEAKARGKLRELGLNLFFASELPHRQGGQE